MTVTLEAHLLKNLLLSDSNFRVCAFVYFICEVVTFSPVSGAENTVLQTPESEGIVRRPHLMKYLPSQTHCTYVLGHHQVQNIFMGFLFHLNYFIPNLNKKIHTIHIHIVYVPIYRRIRGNKWKKIKSTHSEIIRMT